MTNNRPRILVCDSIAQVGIDMLRRVCDVDVRTGLSEEELTETVAGYDALVVRSATAITAGIIEAATRLKVIARAGAGLDTIDVVAAQRAGVEVVNAPSANTLAVAEHTMGLILALARHIPAADHSMKEGKWEKRRLMGHGLAGKTLGIIGFGRIGREVAKRAQAFEMQVIVNDIIATPELNLEAGVETVDLDDLLARSDYLSIHVPGLADTDHLIGVPELRKMRPTAYVVNAARGSVVDGDGLLQAIEEGWIAGAALDVFAVEPVVDSPLARHPKVIATPHLAASTVDAQRDAATTVAEKLLDMLDVEALHAVLPLRIVPIDQVYPHELVDRKRVDRLARRLDSDGVLINPPVVTLVGDHGYIVLDGATRTAALRQLGFDYSLVQVATPEDGLDMVMWRHVVAGIEPDELLAAVQDVPGVHMDPVAPEQADEEMVELGAAAQFRLRAGGTYLVHVDPGGPRFASLNRFTQAYIEAGEVERTIETDIVRLQHEFPDLAAVVSFPELTIGQIMQIVRSGRTLPAGITRFVIPGRILRLNAPLDLLGGSAKIEERNRGLRDLLRDRSSHGGIRYYHEPVILLDE